MDVAMQIRSAISKDAARMAVLLGELGYPVDALAVLERLAQLRDPSTDAVLVAADDGHVVGCLSLHVMPLLHQPAPFGRITALVVDAQRRSAGVGAALLRAAHAWFLARGCASVEVTSGDQRERAHRFYEAHGYVRRSQRFVRALDGAPVSSPAKAPAA